MEEEDYAIAKAKLKKGLDALGESDKRLEYKLRTRLAQAYQHSYELDSMKMQLDLLDQMEPLDSLSKALNHYATYIYYYRSDSKDGALENILLTTIWMRPAKGMACLPMPWKRKASIRALMKPS